MASSDSFVPKSSCNRYKIVCNKNSKNCKNEKDSKIKDNNNILYKADKLKGYLFHFFHRQIYKVKLLI